MSKKIFSVIIISCAIIVSSASLLYAQDTQVDSSVNNTGTNVSGDTDVITKSKSASDAIIITGRRYESSVLKEGKAVTVITEEEIKASGKDDVSEVLETVPGITVSREGTDGGLAYIFMRGASGSNVLIMIDGVRIDDPSAPDRRLDLSFLKTGSVERIEIIRGSMSSLYGSEASGGVINIITKTGRGNFIKLGFTGGMYNKFSQSFSLSEKNDTGALFISAEHISSGGISTAKDMNGAGNFDDDNTENYTASCKYTGKFWEKTSVSFNMNYSDKETDIDKDTALDDPNFKVLNRLFTSSGEFRHSPTLWWNYKAGISIMTLDRVNTNPSDPVNSDINIFTYQSTAVRGHLINNFILPVAGTVSIGAEYSNESADVSSLYSYPPTFINDKNVYTMSLYIHDACSIDEMLFINTGIRLDNNKEFGNHYTWDASAAFIVPVIETKLRASAGSAFRAPSLYQLYADVFGNPDLNPETSLVFDTGILQEFAHENNSVTFEATYFYQKYDNMIDLSGSKYVNINGKDIIQGVELSTSLNLSDFIKVTYAFTRLGPVESFKPYLRRSKYMHSAEVTVIPVEGLSINTSYNYVGSKDDVWYDTSWNPHYVTLDPYHKVDANIRYTLNPMLTLTARGENLTNADYMDTYGYNTYGRGFFGGVELTF